MLFFTRCEYTEYVETIEKIGSLCTDIFFVIGKTARYHTNVQVVWDFFLLGLIKTHYCFSVHR